MMEQSFMPRSLWTNDSKFLHHHVTDFFTSVQVTQDIPTGTSFGPCVLHNTFYDTIAFIALKSFDKREKSYVFRVDPEAMKSSPLVVPWLRFVQAAMNTEEQNTEAYLKSGQLYFRTIRDVRQGEELLVWYDEELSHLLGFSDVKQRSISEDFLCGRCGQVFKNENPFLAHCRFLCTQVKTDIIRTDNEHKQTEVKRQRKVTDFHNIARDLEHKKPGSAEDNLTRKRKPEETLSLRNRKTVLLEKTNITNHKTITDINKSYPFGHDLTESTMKATEDGLSIYELKSSKSSSNTGKPAEPRYEDTPLIKDATRQNPSGSSHQSDREAHMGLQSDSSAFSFVLPGSTHEEQKSAFCKPNKRIPEGSQTTPSALCGPQKLPDVSETYNSKTAVGYRNLLASHLFQCDLPSTQTMVSAPLTTKGSFHFTHEHWSTTINGQLPANPSLTILPPTFSSLGVSVQNWCAKCNLSFRMTSDLVFHMRSHHKKEFSAESQVRRRREEKLTCPICNEYFRERHHLSRHMTSHN